jgi:hypothetical protein
MCGELNDQDIDVEHDRHTVLKTDVSLIVSAQNANNAFSDDE